MMPCIFVPEARYPNIYSIRLAYLHACIAFTCILDHVVALSHKLHVAAECEDDIGFHSADSSALGAMRIETI